MPKRIEFPSDRLTPLMLKMRDIAAFDPDRLRLVEFVINEVHVGVQYDHALGLSRPLEGAQRGAARR